VQIRPDSTQHCHRMFVAIVNEMDVAPITRFRRRGPEEQSLRARASWHSSSDHSQDCRTPTPQTITGACLPEARHAACTIRCTQIFHNAPLKRSLGYTYLCKNCSIVRGLRHCTLACRWRLGCMRGNRTEHSSNAIAETNSDNLHSLGA
jgi:hypothetical protein